MSAQRQPQADTGLRVENLDVTFGRGGKAFRVVEELDFSVPPGRMLGLVGESGSGKSMTASALLGLLPWGGRISRGSIQLNGRELANLPERRMRAVRGREIGMIFQNPLSSLNPSMTIARQIGEPYRLYTGASETQARDRALELLREVGVPDAAQRLDDYPHQFSGGMRQRVMIAMALACKPRLLIADEPTTALDVTIQAQILRLLKRLQDDMQLSVILITHDLSLVAEYADDIMVMYAGRSVEHAPAQAFFRAPRHPYSHALLNSIPRLADPEQRLADIDGIPPSPQDFPPGCRFAPRCNRVTPECTQAYPPASGGAHRFHCLHPLGENA
ncbi:ABC transporter ATP-binding protein [Acidihalobacter ferrooxydans]|uniref:ABC-type dipeptide transporter n=1 Tax=Acidihalobacter ferrooxydans TaxID=1765967 RepID=A0A1P8UK14_9GAMM|nr:ABC transporter ATP-binding protein [Acidihalobacter ferrooxydans]APZ44144.1 methionine ABC transporter ATP-binding protein [Acidihalobacter ferrooxydans]